jgi:N-ethylmaleimide reductase
MSTLFDPIHLGSITLKNRIIMAPLTRGRADANGIPTKLMANYYAQRASAGLIIAEATAVSRDGHGWLNSPGLYTDEQQQGWKNIAESVHSAHGKIFVQLWHMGAAVHPDFIAGDIPVSSSSTQLAGQLTTPRGRDQAFVTPRALSITEISQQVANFAQAARRAVDAGLDGVELHAANGFLIDQFTRDSSNKRTDAYGGSIEKRLRFMREVVEAVCQEIGASRVGIRLSPTNKVWNISDSEYSDTFTQAAELLNGFDLAYLHLLEPHPDSGHGMETIDYLTPKLRKHYHGTLLVNGGYSMDSASAALESNLAEAVAFGIAFIANPDLVERYRNQSELASPNPDLFYTNGAEGYTDYTSLAAELVT